MSKKPMHLVLFFVVFIDLVGFGIVIPMLPLFARSLQASASEVGALMFVYSLSQMLLAPFWGALSDRFGRKPILILTMAGQALCYMWAGFVHDFFSLLLSRAAAGVFAGNISTANAFMADVTSKEDRVKGMGLMGAAFGLGFIFGPAIGGLMMKGGTSLPFFVAGGLCLANLIVAAFVLNEATTVEERFKNRRRISWREVFSSKRSGHLLLLVLISFCFTMALTQLEVVFALFALDRFHLDPHQALYFFAGMGIIMALVQGGFVGRLNKKYKETRLALTGAVCICLGLSSLVFSYSITGGFLSVCVLAIGYSLANPCLMAMVSKSVSEQHQGSAFGLYQSSSSLARILGPLLAGPLYDHRIELPFVSGVCFTVLAGLLLTMNLFKLRREPL